MHAANPLGVFRDYTQLDYAHLMMRRGRKTAKVAMARRLAVRLYWMMRQGWDDQQGSKFGSHAGQPGHRHGVPSNIE
jgi:transposase